MNSKDASEQSLTKRDNKGKILRKSSTSAMPKEWYYGNLLLQEQYRDGREEILYKGNNGCDGTGRTSINEPTKQRYRENLLTWEKLREWQWATKGAIKIEHWGNQVRGIKRNRVGEILCQKSNEGMTWGKSLNPNFNFWVLFSLPREGGREVPPSVHPESLVPALCVLCAVFVTITRQLQQLSLHCGS